MENNLKDQDYIELAKIFYGKDDVESGSQAFFEWMKMSVFLKGLPHFTGVTMVNELSNTPPPKRQMSQREINRIWREHTSAEPGGTINCMYLGDFTRAIRSISSASSVKDKFEEVLLADWKHLEDKLKKETSTFKIEYLSGQLQGVVDSLCAYRTHSPSKAHDVTEILIEVQNEIVNFCKRADLDSFQRDVLNESITEKLRSLLSAKQ